MKATSALSKRMDSCFRRNDGSGDRKENKVSHMNTSMELNILEGHLSEMRFSNEFWTGPK